MMPLDERTKLTKLLDEFGPIAVLDVIRSWATQADALPEYRGRRLPWHFGTPRFVVLAARVLALRTHLVAEGWRNPGGAS